MGLERCRRMRDYGYKANPPTTLQGYLALMHTEAYPRWDNAQDWVIEVLLENERDVSAIFCSFLCTSYAPASRCFRSFLHVSSSSCIALVALYS